MTATIPLLAGDGTTVGHALVDPPDEERFSPWTWRLHPDGYAVRYERIDGRLQAVFLHREILSLEHGDGRLGDHINRDRLDNRRFNLRSVTRAESQQNRRGWGQYSRGVVRDGRRWRAHARLNGRRIDLGSFDSEQAATEAAAAFRAEAMACSEEASEVDRDGERVDAEVSADD